MNLFCEIPSPSECAHPQIIAAVSDASHLEYARARLSSKFEIQSVIGQGAMGVIYRARALHSSEIVALKVLRPELQQSDVAARYFSREVKMQMKVKHPNILPILGMGGQGMTSWFITPLIEPGCLLHYLKKRPLSSEQIVRVAMQIGEALAFAHGLGIIHRDIKPTNVLIDSSEFVYLADFGLSRPLLNPWDGVRETFSDGTPQYQAPCALRGEVSDSRGDIYSFGATLYQMLSGEPPYRSKTRIGVLAEMDSPLRKTPDHGDNTRAALGKLCEGAMALELEERYASMGYVLSDLVRISNGLMPLGPCKRFMA